MDFSDAQFAAAVGIFRASPSADCRFSCRTSPPPLLRSNKRSAPPQVRFVSSSIRFISPPARLLNLQGIKATSVQMLDAAHGESARPTVVNQRIHHIRSETQPAPIVIPRSIRGRGPRIAAAAHVRQSPRRCVAEARSRVLVAIARWECRKDFSMNNEQLIMNNYVMPRMVFARR